MTKPTPILRQAVRPEAIVTQRPLSAQATKSANLAETEETVRDLSALAGAFEWLKHGVAGKMDLLPPELRATPPSYEKGGRLAAADASEGLRKIAELYRDQHITEEEVPSLAMARGRLEKVLEMVPAIAMLPPPVQKRLREQLFDPMRVLVDAAAKHAAMVKGAVHQRDADALRQRLIGAVEYHRLDVSEVTRTSHINGAQRYDIGDLIRVVAEDGTGRLGVVTGRRDDGSLIAEWLDVNNQIHLEEMSPEKVAKENRLKIGDTFQKWGHTYWVTGLNPDRQLRIVDEQGRAYEAHDMLNALMPLEKMIDPSAAGLFAGNVENKTVFANTGRAGEVGLFTFRGHKYSHDWNEDGGCAFIDGHGRVYAGAFDQAGGEGSDPQGLGAASKIAGKSFSSWMQRIAQGHRGIEDGIEAMRSAVGEAHREVLARGKREATTFVGAMIDGRRAAIVNLGDSGAMHFGADGKFIEKTQDQGIGNVIFDAIGYPHKGGQMPRPDVYRWNVAQGEYIVLGSDGLFDSKLTEQEIGSIITRAGSAEAATRALRDEVVRRMKTGEGKRDNLTISVVRVGTPAV